MKKFIQLSFREKSFKKYLIDINKIDYVIEDENSNIGSFVYLEGLEKPFHVLESVRSINDLISCTFIFPSDCITPFIVSIV